ncbi:hypothetical protein M885DRAFT_525068 [Pelagophyceae sp. CCMP2097]|nr:hypothetical protein M885DRAFT_525068 [Pelagophyceae sp. CCMP2097]
MARPGRETVKRGSPEGPWTIGALGRLEAPPRESVQRDCLEGPVLRAPQGETVKERPSRRDRQGETVKERPSKRDRQGETVKERPSRRDRPFGPSIWPIHLARRFGPVVLAPSRVAAWTVFRGPVFRGRLQGFRTLFF